MPSGLTFEEKGMQRLKRWIDEHDERRRVERNSDTMMGRKRGKKILRHVTALFFDFITVLANLISERRHNITIYEW